MTAGQTQQFGCDFWDLLLQELQHVNMGQKGVMGNPPRLAEQGIWGRKDRGTPGKDLVHFVLSASASHCLRFYIYEPVWIAWWVFNFLWFDSEQAFLGTVGTFSVLLAGISVQSKQRKNILIVTMKYKGGAGLAGC